MYISSDIKLIKLKKCLVYAAIQINIKMASSQQGRIENFAGEDFLLGGGNLMWSDFDHSNLFKS